MGIASMTGFGAGTGSEGEEEISVELRSVNGKFCEVKARLPRELAALEQGVVRRVKERLGRGNVDVFVRRRSPQGLTAVPRVNAALVQAYADALREAGSAAGLRTEALEIRDLLGLEGVVSLEERPPDLPAVERVLATSLDAALDRLVEVRRREGEALETDLRGRLGTVRSLTGRIGALSSEAVGAWRDRLTARVNDVLAQGPVDPGRIEQEVVLFADRTDVSEELTRLDAHLEEFARLLEREGPVGRQLDFLLQEINREVNTTGSKSQVAELARIVVELKAEIERIREQVQNVE